MTFGEAMMGAEIGTKVIGGLTGGKKGGKKASSQASQRLITNQFANTPGYKLDTSYWPAHNQVGTTLTKSDETLGIESGINDTLGKIRETQGLVRPGFGALTQAVTRAIADAKAVAGGNLRESLARRKVAGASFGLDAETRLNSEFAKLDSEARAQSFMAEFSTTLDLINSEHSILRGQLDDGMRLLGIATGQGAGVAQLSQQNAAIEAQLAAQEAAGAGRLAGQTTGEIANAFGQLGSMFGGSNAGNLGAGSWWYGGA